MSYASCTLVDNSYVETVKRLLNKNYAILIFLNIKNYTY